MRRSTRRRFPAPGLSDLRILVIDNYDSFTYNLVQYLGEISGTRIQVFRNDEVTVDGIRRARPHSSGRLAGALHPG